MNSYELSRSFTDWCFSNPEKVKPIHYAIYFFAIEHCNRLGWKYKFGFPSQMVMEAIGVKNWRTYSSGLDELVEFGFIEMIEISKNQYSSNIIAIVKNTKAHTKALDKALSKHIQKHSTKHSQSTVSIDKQLNNITRNKEQEREESTHETFKPTVIFTSPEIENQEQRKVAPKESNYVIYPIEEIEQRFKNWEFELWEGAMRNYQITKEEYEKGVDLFIYEQGPEKLKRDYGENVRHFKAWIKLNIKHIKNQKDERKFAGVSSSTIEQTFNAFKKKQPTAEN
jgi:hypothetical protein